MKKKNPIEKSRYINERYKEYLKSSFKFGTKNMQQLFESQLRVEELYKGPFVDLQLPFKRGKNIEQLIAEGVISPSFRNLGGLDLNRPLYSHQEESIRNINAGNGAIITTGTGSGKTESFLFPILNEILKEGANENSKAGIRAIFLYPMNALVNDQIERVRKLLINCPSITYGFYTGETPEEISRTNSKFKDSNGETTIPVNEMVSRKEMRENPPHILFTNYSMLEYLLIRPKDNALFAYEKLGNWKFVVLDEAHSYAGSLGIELSYLMRRLTALAPTKPRFLLTSATLGEQGKSEKDIVSFATKLTSARFTVNDIIFSKRILLEKNKTVYRIASGDYTLLKKNLSNIQEINEIAKNYGSFDSLKVNEVLFDLLVCDENVYELYLFLHKQCREFKDILALFEDKLIYEEQLADLIDLINIAEKDGIGLFDLKYHSFVRPLAGAYVTLGPKQKLSLTKTNILEGQRAFEVGNCRYCSAPYIIGKIKYNDLDGLNYLFQNKEVDIYENYGDNQFVKLDYFLIDNSSNEEEEELVDNTNLEEHKVCNKCGVIYSNSNLNANKCTCGDEHLVSIYKVSQSTGDGDEVAFNNINQCPCCGHKSRGGIVKGLNLGKDEGTALISQMLLEALEEGEDVSAVQKKSKLTLSFKTKALNETNKTKAKQFLSFSDSRQQASFAAAFQEANHLRMLRKRLILKVIEDNNYKDIPVDLAVSELTAMIERETLFPNELSATKNAWIAVLVDLLKVDGAYDGEGLGLYYFDLNLEKMMSLLDEADVEEAFGMYGITKSDLGTIIQVMFEVFKTTPAINYTKSTLLPDEKKENLEFRRFDNQVMLSCPSSINNVRSFLPIKTTDNKVVRYIQKVFGCDADTARNNIDLIFNSLGVEGKILKPYGPEQASFQIDVSDYIIKNYVTSKYYCCSKCGRLTPHNVKNKCVHDRCDGVLNEVNPDDILRDNYYRNQYKTMKIERVVVKEHTAQLDRKVAKQYQDDFKDKKINVLHCSTTFEMGIDIGDLETVFMRNVPPTPANYVQRAGRAGRRKDSAAFILTYCGTSSHDYTYFAQPEKMISGKINPPFFNVLNEKIIQRHLMAIYLGFFFRENPHYFNSVKELVFEDGIEKFKEFMRQKPESVSRYVDQKVLPESIYSNYHKLKWFELIQFDDEKMRFFEDYMKAMLDEFTKAKEEYSASEDFKQADYFTGQIGRLQQSNVIESLSKYCVIPKYGFPVDVVDLQIYNEGMLVNKYDLTRDLKVAISEYAPDSEIIVDGKKYTSKYVSLPKTGDYTKHYFCTCNHCKKVNVFVSTITSTCKYCGAAFDGVGSEYYIEPTNGFKTGVTKESTRMKPKRSYAGEITYLGGGVTDEITLDLHQVLHVETSTNDELLIMNKSNFYMCPACGYSEIDKVRNALTSIRKKHKNYRQFDCGCDELNRVKLGHSFKTDVARIKIPSLDSMDAQNHNKALSFMYALLEGISEGLEIERNDINGIIEFSLDTNSFDILVFDNVPGGAGHVKRLVERNSVSKALEHALVKVSQECCDEHTSCYNCLRNYNNQSFHNKLQRNYAKELIAQLIQQIQ